MALLLLPELAAAAAATTDDDEPGVVFALPALLAEEDGDEECFVGCVVELGCMVEGGACWRKAAMKEDRKKGR